MGQGRAGGGEGETRVEGMEGRQGQRCRCDGSKGQGQREREQECRGQWPHAGMALKSSEVVLVAE